MINRKSKKNAPKKYTDLPSYRELIKSDVDLFVSVAKHNKSTTRASKEDAQLDVVLLSGIRSYLGSLVSSSEIGLILDADILKETYKMYSFKGCRRMMIDLAHALAFSEQYFNVESKPKLLKDLLRLAAIDSNGWFFKYSTGLNIAIGQQALYRYTKVLKAVFDKREFNYRNELDNLCRANGYPSIIVERLLYVLGYAIVKSGRNRFHLTLEKANSYYCPLNGNIDSRIEKYMTLNKLVL